VVYHVHLHVILKVDDDVTRCSGARLNAVASRHSQIAVTSNNITAGACSDILLPQKNNLTYTIDY